MNDTVEPEILHISQDISQEESQTGAVKLPILKRIPIFLKARKRLVAAVGVILLLVLLLVGVLFKVSKEAKEFYTSAMSLSDIAKEQDLLAIKDNLGPLKKEHSDLVGAYRLLTPFKFVPFLGAYVSDGEIGLKGIGHGLEAAEAGVGTLEPYSDILGFATEVKAAEAGGGEKTAQERLDFIIGSLPEIVPKVGAISEKLSLARVEFEKINPDKYPKSLFGRDIQDPLREAIGLVVNVDEFIKKGKPLLEVSPFILGSEEKRQYLILFQNDKELRPTGGFLTAYSIAEVEKGKFNPVDSADTYSLDAKYRPKVKAPQPIIDYIGGIYKLNPNFRLRDMNWSPDFKESIELFLRESQGLGIDDIDGVIAVDTHLLVNILEVLGPIGVPGFGNFSTEITDKCNCPQVIYELESFADVEGPIVWDPLDPSKIIYAPANFDNRKKIIGPLMNSILSNSMAQPKEKIPALFNAVFKSVTEKHVLLYFHDDKSQAAAESFGIAGTISDTDHDYLHINDANLGGRKSNLYVTTEVRQEINVSGDGSVEKTVEITYKNPQSYDGWLNSVLPNWTRVYIPKGSEVVDVTGFENEGETVEEFGKTVVSGGFKLRPQGVSKISVTYKLPFKVTGEYKLLIQKQPGVTSPLHGITFNGREEEFILNEDKEMSFRLN